MKENIAVRAIITDEEGRVFMAKRSRGAGMGQFSLLGGKPDEGETHEQSVIREVKEESNLDFTPTFYKEKVDEYSDPENSWRVIYFTGITSGEMVLHPEEHDEGRFVTEQELEQLDIAFDHRERLKEYFEDHDK